MTIRKLADGAAFVAIDLDDADRSIGIVRQARKILQGGAKDLARSLTYGFASLELAHGGASAGISAETDDRDEAVAAFVDEVADMVSAGLFLPDPGKGVAAAELAPLTERDPRSPVRLLDRDGVTFADELAALSAAVAAERTLDGLEGQRIAIEGFDVNGPALVRELTGRGARLVTIQTSRGTVTDREGLDPGAVAQAWVEHGPAMVDHVGRADDISVFAADVDILVPSSKMGCLGHTEADTVQAAVVLPGAPLPITARGLAFLRRREALVVPDFVAQAGPIWAWEAAADADPDTLRAQVEEGTSAIIDEVLDHQDGPFLAACHRAEAFLSTWRDSLPFGRPLAS